MLKFKHTCVVALFLHLFFSAHLFFPSQLKATPPAPEISAQRAADYIHAVIQANRTTYSKYIVERLRETVSLKATENWRRENTLPLPAQFLMATSQRVNSRNMGIHYRLISLWPINKDNGPKTTEEKTGLEKVALNQDQPFHWITQSDGQPQFNAIYADQAVTGSCAHCHNQHPQSPKSNFKRGDVMGGVHITFPLKNNSHQSLQEKTIGLALVTDYIHSILEADRTFYSKDVVDRLQANNIIFASENWWKENTLLLPAQFMLNAADLVHNMRLGLSYKLISNWPINPNNHPTGSFETVGLRKVVSNPSSKHRGIIKRNHRLFFSTVYPDRAVTPACVTCHNHHPNSPKHDFKMNDAIGGVVIIIPLEEN